MEKVKFARKGFTLIEVIVAIVILTLGILAVSQMTVMGMRTSSVINRQMYAREVLSRFYERFGGLPASDTFYLKDKVDNFLDDTATGQFEYEQWVTSHGGQYHVIWNVENGMINDTAPDVRFKVVRIHVLWPDAKTWVKGDVIKRF